jgi:hypothetical protein
VPGLDFKSSVERVAAFQAGSIPVPRRHFYQSRYPFAEFAAPSSRRRYLSTLFFDAFAQRSFQTMRVFNPARSRALPIDHSTGQSDR